MTETSYQQRLREAEAAVARGALGRDLAAAIAGQAWVARIRDAYDAATLVDFIAERATEPGFIAKIHAAADQARAARGRGRGRPKKTEKPAKAGTAKTTARTATTETVAAV